jgi:hypothetical protein
LWNGGGGEIRMWGINKKRKKLESYDTFFMNKGFVDEVAIRHIKKKKGLVYGGKALNLHLPSHLERKSKDFDVYSNKPKKSAKELEKHLDKFYNNDLFETKRAKYKRTYKVVNKVTGNTVADFTKPEKKVPYKVSPEGIKYAKLQYIKAKLIKILKDPRYKFRHKQDRDALRRIRIYEKLYYGGSKW